MRTILSLHTTILFCLVAFFTTNLFAAEAHVNNHQDAHLFLGLEGLYELNTEFENTDGDVQNIKPLNRLVFLYDPNPDKQSLSIHLSVAGTVKPAYSFNNLDFDLIEKPGKIVISKVRSNTNPSFDGEFRIEFDLETGEFSGHYKGGRYGGVKHLSGKPKHTVGSLPNLKNALTTPANVQGIYSTSVFIARTDDISKGYWSRVELTVNRFEDNLVSANIVYVDAAKTFQYFQLGLYTPSLGLMSFTKANQKTGSFHKLILFTQKEGGKDILEGFVVSTAGKGKYFKFSKTNTKVLDIK